MAKLDFNNYQNFTQQQSRPDTPTTSHNYARVTYFNLTNDGDEAIVRFPYSTPDQFDIRTVHTVKMGKAFRKINCLRDPREPLDNCPLCKSGNRVQLRFFTKLLMYVKDGSGNIESQACIWDRPASFAQTLKSYMDDYGDLRNLVFKIRRHGAKGDLSTTYDILPANPEIYKPTIYVADFKAFDNFDLSFYHCLDKTFEEMNEYVTTGSFPEKTTTKTQTNSTASVSTNVKTEEPVETSPQNSYAYQTYSPDIPNTSRPRRYVR